LSVVLRIRPAPRELKKVADLAQRTPEVVECHRITGDDCYLMRAWVRDVAHLEELIDRFAPYGQTTTSIVQSSPVEPRGLPFDTL
jgi:Lrp/AsnC family transcriptional regulator, leucine-responsive regulatory protein